MLISVIMPAYNCSRTVKNAVNSVLRQNLFQNDIELIIVNDGSTDDTADVLRSLAKNDNRIRLIDQTNAGPAKARNKGIDAATGEYIMFIDSDDEFCPGVFEKTMGAIGSDIIIFGFRQRFDGKAEDKVYSPVVNCGIDELYKNNLLNQVWNKVYKRSFLNEHRIRFPDHKYGEDRLFNAAALKQSPSITLLSDILYNYNMDNGVSLVSGYVPGKFDACKKIYHDFTAICTDENTVRYMFLKNILSSMTVLFAGNCSLTLKEKKVEVKAIISDNTVAEAMQYKQAAVAAEIIRRIVKTKNTNLNYVFARSVAFCQKRLLPLFLKFRG